MYATWNLLSLPARAQLQAEVARLYEQYRNEADARFGSPRSRLAEHHNIGTLSAHLPGRKMLVSDYNDLKYRQQEQKSEETGTEEREDPVVLKLKLA